MNKIKEKAREKELKRLSALLVSLRRKWRETQDMDRKMQILDRIKQVEDALDRLN